MANTLIPELNDWNNGRGIEIDAWISIVGRYDQLIGYASLLWPTFVEYQDCIFRGHIPPDVFKDAMTQLSNNKRDVELMMNHVHVADMFVNSNEVLTRQQLEFICNLLKETWRARANVQLGKDVIIVMGGEGGDLKDMFITLRSK